jgi:plastocyanin
LIRNRFRLLAIAPAMLLVIAAVAACGGDDSTSTKTAAPASTTAAVTTAATTTTTGGASASPSAAASGGAEIDQSDLAFKPAKLTVKAGEKVLFKNTESALHTVDINGKNESGNMKKDATFTWTAGAAGEYKITCEYHPQMNATITVQ